MAADTPAPADILEAAGNLLAERLDGEWSRLESESTVLRARTGSGRSVIVKHVTDTGFDDPDHDGAPQRFLNEWAGLELLAELGASPIAPAVIAADAASGLLVLEDLGDVPNLEALLVRGDGQRARSGLEQFGSTLGRLHGVGVGEERTFRAIQDRLGTGSPHSDTTMDQRSRRDLFAACFEAAGAAMTDRVWEAVVEIEGLIHGSSPFWTLTHADSGPHNLLVTPDGGRLIDFEFCVYRSGLTDVAGARLGFPQTASSMVVPIEDVERLEGAYRRSLESVVPEVGDSAVFDRALGAACAHWALNRVAAGWLLHVAPRLETGMSLPDDEADRLARTSVIVDGFAGLAETCAVFGELASVLTRCVGHWRHLWPEIESIDVYPALRNGV